MSDVNLSKTLDKLDSALKAKLNALTKSSSLAELQQLTSYAREAVKLKKALTKFSGDYEEDWVAVAADESMGITEDESANYVGLMATACHHIVQLYKVADLDRIQKDEVEWVLDDATDFLFEVRRLFGSRIPKLPHFSEEE